MGEYDAVSASQRFAALAWQIAGLGRQREEDRRQLDAARTEVGQLAERVGALTRALAGALDAGKLKSPQAPRWDGLEQEQLAAQLGHLRDWVNGVLLAHYPEYKLPPCWDRHRSAWWELGNLCAEWTRIYANSAGPDLEAALWWHERWLPGTIGRLTRAINSDGAMGCREHAGYGRQAVGW
jgi:hypothetical protein